MAGFSTAINGIRTLLQLMDVAGNNIANAKTPGYHARQAKVVPVLGALRWGVRIGQGTEVTDVVRLRDELIERTLLSNIQIKARLRQQKDSLALLEGIFAEPSFGSLNGRLGDFLSSLEKLAADPFDATLRNDVVLRADSVASAFNRISREVDTFKGDLRETLDSLIDKVNSLTAAIASLNVKIKQYEASGVGAPDLRDERDRLISELAELVNVSTFEGAGGEVSVMANGTALVSGALNTPLEADMEDGVLAVYVEGDRKGVPLRLTEGKIAGVLQVYNEVLPWLDGSLDDLANAFRRSVNLIHTVSLPSSGRFRSLEGSNALLSATVPVSETGYDVPAGTNHRLVVNVEDETTGDVSQYEIPVDTTLSESTFVANLAAALSAVPHLTASVSDGRLRIESDAGYTFGFATQYDPDPVWTTAGGASPPSLGVSGEFEGDQDLFYTLTAQNGGVIGTDTLDFNVEVRDRAGTLLRSFTLSVPSDYGEGEPVVLENGLSVSFGAGDVVAGDSFSFTAHSSMDTAGVLDVLGMNTLMDGLGAGDIHVAERIKNDPSLLAGALTEQPGDNRSFLRMSLLGEQRLLEGGTKTMDEFYRSVLGDIGTMKNAKEVQFNNLEALVKDFENRRDAISGVNVDEEGMHLIRYQRIYQGLAKYVSVIDSSLKDLLSVV